MTPDHDVEIRILSQPRYCCVVRAAVGAAASRLGFDEAAAGQVQLAVDEALTNIMRHGYDGATDQPIWIGLTPADHRGRPALRITIEDRARQVDPQVICGRDLRDLRPGGLGVHIIQQVMDEVRYAPRPQGGMCLTMTRALPAAASIPSCPHEPHRP